MKSFLQSRVFDPLQFRYDIFPRLSYQPLPWLGLEDARRSEGTVARWLAIEGAIEQMTLRSALDIGCNSGFFSIGLARKGIPTLGVDLDDRFLRIARYTARKVGVRNLGFSNLRLSLETVDLLPSTELTLLLSVWHHWVKDFGFDEASRLLGAVWSKARGGLFFETGENEMPGEYGLPRMEPSARQWLTAYLEDVCVGGAVLHLGEFKAFAPKGKEGSVYRNLFQVVRGET